MRRARGIPSPYMGGRMCGGRGLYGRKGGMANLAGRTRNLALVASGMRRMYGNGWLDSLKSFAKSAYSTGKKVIDDNPFIKQGLKDVAKTGIEYGTSKLAEKYGRPQAAPDTAAPVAPAAKAKVKDVVVKQKPSKVVKPKPAPSKPSKKQPAVAKVSPSKAGPAVRMGTTNPVTSMFRAGAIMRGPIP